jgi:hypothetical protein
MCLNGVLGMLLLCALLLAPATASASLPLITDDTETLGRGRFQLEVWASDEHDKETVSGTSLENHSLGIVTILTYGFVDTVDLMIGLPYQRITEKEDGVTTLNANGISDMTLDAKWRFYKAEGLSFALKPGVILPIGNENKNLGAGRTRYGAIFITKQELSPWEIDMNLGYIRNNNTLDQRKDIWLASLAAEIEAAKKLELVAEAGIATNTDKGSDIYPIYLQTGLIYSLTEQVDLSFGLLVGLNSAAPDYSLRPGLTVRF